MLNIINKSKCSIPSYAEDDLRELARKAGFAPAAVTLILGNRRKGSEPSGLYPNNKRAVIVRISPNIKHEDFRFVLAHELGHLKQDLEVNNPTLLRARSLPKWNRPTEKYANEFAIVQCHCYPVADYRVKRYIKKAKKRSN